MVLCDSDDDEQEQTVKYNPLKTAGGPAIAQYLPKSSVKEVDDRPITPLKDKMVYDKLYSSLDFKDGKFLVVLVVFKFLRQTIRVCFQTSQFYTFFLLNCSLKFSLGP